MSAVWISVSIAGVSAASFKVGQYWERGMWLGSEKRWQQFHWRHDDPARGQRRRRTLSLALLLLVIVACARKPDVPPPIRANVILCTPATPC